VGGRVDRPLTVLQVLPALNAGGVERSTLEVAAELVRRGHRSLVISAGGRLVPQLLDAGSTHVNWPIGRKSPAVLLRVQALRRLLLAEGVDILHARSRLPAWIAWMAWRGMHAGVRPRFVTTVHGLNSVNAYSAVMLRGERVIAVSAAARDYVLHHYPGMDPARISVIRRGVDPAVFAPGYRPPPAWFGDWYRRHPQLRDRYVLTLAGRISRRKGVEDLLEIVTGLRAQGIPAQGLLVGELPPARRGARQALGRRLAAAGAAEAVTITGFRADMREVLAASSVVLSLSRQPEAFGRTVNEALSLQVPVAAYAHGGVGEQLQRHFPAGALPPGDIAAMIDCLRQWYTAPPPMQGVAAFTLQDMLARTLTLYRGLRDQGRPDA